MPRRLHVRLRSGAANSEVMVWPEPATGYRHPADMLPASAENRASALSRTEFEMVAPASFGDRVIVALRRQFGPPLQVALDLRRGVVLGGHAEPIGVRVSGATVEIRFDDRTPDEAVMATGFDESGSGATTQTFSRTELALSRFLHMFRASRHHPALAPGAVLTVFSFGGSPLADGDNRTYWLRQDRFVLGSTTLPRTGSGVPRGLRGRAGRLYWMSSMPITLPGTRASVPASILCVYTYLHSIGQAVARVPGASGWVRELGFLSHAYFGGPALVNSFRRRADLFCSDDCRIDLPHDHLDLMTVPSLPALTTPVATPAAWLAQPGYSSRDHALIYPNDVRLPRRDPTPLPGRMHVRDPADRDPRNTDFVDATLLDAPLAVDTMRRALHPDAAIRVWGCSNGDYGTIFRHGASARTVDPGENRLVDFQHTFNPHWGRPVLGQRWRVRAGDIALMYLSDIRRSYAQAIAQAFQRSCWAALPGTGANWTDGALGGMEVPEYLASQIRPLASRLLGAPREDENRYFEYRPLPPPRVPFRLRVLVTGFGPFTGVPDNASSRLVRPLSPAVLAGAVQPPPWLDASIDARFLVDVPVTWSCAVPGRAAPTTGGALDILAATRAHDATLVVVVGQDSGIPAGKVRVERFARNRTTVLGDAVGATPSTGQALIAGGPQLIESTIPRAAWLAAQRALGERNFVSSDYRDSAGEFICNNSFYELLHEATIGRHASGRWVVMMHVASLAGQEGEEAPMRAALVSAIAAIVEHLMWASARENWVLPHGLMEAASSRHPDIARGVIADVPDVALRHLP
jgi:pyroglutamyl-peptidase